MQYRVQNGADTAFATHIGRVNPFRYRGYYYDEETNLYYLQSRYYDPTVCRFINADDVAYIAPETLNGLNLFAYCGNNPVMRTDSQGASWWTDFWSGVGNWFKTYWPQFVSNIEILAGVVLLFVPGAQPFVPLLLGMGISSLAGGYANQLAGGSFLAGWIGGQITGLISGIPISGAQDVLGFAGGSIGNFVTGVIDKYLYDRNISWWTVVLSSMLAGGVNALFNFAAPKVAFGEKLGSDWYNVAAMGYSAYVMLVWSLRSLILSFVSGYFPNI